MKHILLAIPDFGASQSAYEFQSVFALWCHSNMVYVVSLAFLVKAIPAVSR